jgi:hypothetical protein
MFFLTLISIWLPDYKLSQTNTVELRTKKKSQLKKVTGFQVNYSLFNFLSLIITLCQ